MGIAHITGGMEFNSRITIQKLVQRIILAGFLDNNLQDLQKSNQSVGRKSLTAKTTEAGSFKADMSENPLASTKENVYPIFAKSGASSANKW